MPWELGGIPVDIGMSSVDELIKFQKTFKCSFENFVRIIVPFTERVKKAGQVRVKRGIGNTVYVYTAEMNATGYRIEVIPGVYLSPHGAENMAKTLTNIASAYPESLSHVKSAPLTYICRADHDRRRLLCFKK